MATLRVAFVAPSLAILGGQAVQADRLLRAWRDDPDVAAYLVPINPAPPRPLAFATRVKYLRTIVNELTYGPHLVRDLARADVVHVFSASYSSFLLAPLPAILVARALGLPVVLIQGGEARITCGDRPSRERPSRAWIATSFRRVSWSTSFAASASTPPSSPTSSIWSASAIASAIRFVRVFRLRATSTPSTTSPPRSARSGLSSTNGRSRR